ncbi:radical SAM protein [candidate division WOR-3 bacterium]|nr:radical SAM protein [candidate division WOR-3 bacterium]
MKSNIPFGPVPSRRLGKSLGINNIPPKICTYSCVYCQVGKTYSLSNERKEFYKVEEIKDQVLRKINELNKQKEKIDFLSFVPDGEPTLDINLGKEIEILKDHGIPIAVITNGSLIDRADVRRDLSKANWVSVKIDAVSEKVWKKINRPHPDLSLKDILEGIVKFSKEYKGNLYTETMLIKDINTDKKNIKEIAEFIRTLKIKKAYLSIPTRPPASKSVEVPDEEITNMAYNLFTERNLNTELLIGYSATEFPATKNVSDEILNITSVHPMREEDVKNILDKAGKSWKTVEDLVNKGELKMVNFGKNKFFLRSFKRNI